jgi:hypothetical protein
MALIRDIRTKEEVKFMQDRTYEFFELVKQEQELVEMQNRIISTTGTRFDQLDNKIKDIEFNVKMLVSQMKKTAGAHQAQLNKVAKAEFNRVAGGENELLTLKQVERNLRKSGLSEAEIQEVLQQMLVDEKSEDATAATGGSTSVGGGGGGSGGDGGEKKVGVNGFMKVIQIAVDRGMLPTTGDGSLRWPGSASVARGGGHTPADGGARRRRRDRDGSSSDL